MRKDHESVKMVLFVVHAYQLHLYIQLLLPHPHAAATCSHSKSYHSVPRAVHRDGDQSSSYGYQVPVSGIQGENLMVKQLVFRLVVGTTTTGLTVIFISCNRYKKRLIKIWLGFTRNGMTLAMRDINHKFCLSHLSTTPTADRVLSAHVHMLPYSTCPTLSNNLV